MIFQTGMNLILIVTAVILFVMVSNTIARICLVIGGLLLIVLVNIAFERLFRKKDEMGNTLHSYYVCFAKEKDRVKAKEIMTKYGEVRRKTSRYDVFTTSMTLQQAKNTIRSHLKISEKDYEIFEGR